MELSLCIPSTAIDGIAVPDSATFKGDSISTTTVQTSTSTPSTIEPTSTCATPVAGVVSTHTTDSVLQLSTFSESVTSIYTKQEGNSMSTAILLPLTSAELNISQSAILKENSITSATVSSLTSIALVSSLTIMSLENSILTATTSYNSVLKEDSVSLGNDPISSTPELTILNSLASNEDTISTVTFPISNTEAIVPSNYMMSEESNILPTITPTLASNVSTLFSSTEILYIDSATAGK